MNVADFVIRAAQRGAGVPVERPLMDLTKDGAEVVRRAKTHRVATLVGEALDSESDVPSFVRDELGRELMRSAATRLLCESTLSDTLCTVHRAGVELLVLKGPSIAHEVYPRPELRIYHDLDLLCRVEDYPALYGALMGAGYTSAGTKDRLGTHAQLPRGAYRFRSPHVRSFYDPSGDLKLEIHFDVLQLGSFDRHAVAMWRESRVLHSSGLAMRVLGPEHQLIHLAVHAHRHGYTCLSWLLELDLYVRRWHTSFDWSRAIQIARDEGVGSIFRHALGLCQRILGTPRVTFPRATWEERILKPVFESRWPADAIDGLRQVERKRMYRKFLLGRRRERLLALSTEPLSAFRSSE